MIQLIPYVSAGTIAFVAIAITAGQARVARAVLAASFRQPAAQDTLMKLLLIGLALTETIALVACGIVTVLLTTQYDGPYTALIHIACVGAILLPALVQAYGMSAAAIALVQSVARQPDHPAQATQLFIITQSIGQTPLLFNTLGMGALMYGAPTVDTWAGALASMGIAAIAGFGSLGTCYGMSRFAQALGRAYGYRPNMLRPLFPLTLVSMALLETPFLLAWAIGLVVWQYPPTTIASTAVIMAIPWLIGLCNGVVCYSASRVCATAAHSLAAYQQAPALIIRWSLLAQTFIDTSALYGLMIALLMVVLI